jgi:hypothetical protein
MLKRVGLPRIDSIMGGSYWPAVHACFDRRYNLIFHALSSSWQAEDGEGNLDAL